MVWQKAIFTEEIYIRWYDKDIKNKPAIKTLSPKQK
jgi:hypothetical protein